ncbi:MerR family transcriptional regulator [Streptomyces sp. NBC_01506]|uniref:MerR family transcriptional regulator n=1 Tax=Streptomyces sp. NBC_01506 TaxID=2903887 RepID=UPI00386ACAC6
MTARLTTALAALNCGVRPATIRDWVRRGILTPSGGTPKRPLYRLEDVENARRAPKPNRAGQRATTAA